MGVMLIFEHVTKRRGSRAILTDITFHARPGRVAGFLGPNGAGTSSTLRILLGLDRTTSGEALVNGQRFASLRDPLRSIGNARVEEVLELVGIADAGNKRVSTCSLGMGHLAGLALLNGAGGALGARAVKGESE